jgi:GMP synthase-like glutamine amidotransferase
MIIVIDNSLRIDNAIHIATTLRALGISDFKVVKTHSQLCKVRGATGVILSGSEMMVTDADMKTYSDKFMLNMTALTRFDVPVLAICFGCQLINHVFGGRLRKLDTRLERNAPIMLDGHRASVKFNCGYLIQSLGPDMESLATMKHKKEDFPCFIRHRERPVYGTLFHPESSPETHKMIKTFYDICKTGTHSFTLRHANT